MDLDWVPLFATFLALLSGFLLLFAYGRRSSGVSTGSTSRKHSAQSRLLSQDAASSSNKAGETHQHGDDGSDSLCNEVDAPADSSKTQPASDGHGDPDINKPTPWKRCYHFSNPRGLPPLPHGNNVDVWEVCSSDDASALLAGCPASATICCGFFKPFADGMNAQRSALLELAAAQPSSFVFATVDIQGVKEVALWAGVSEPMVRLLDPTGMVLADFSPAQVKQGLLHQKVLSVAAEVAKAAERKLEALARRFPRTLSSEMMIVSSARSGLEKMRQHGLEALQTGSSSAVEQDMFQALCRCCETCCTPRVREIAAFVKLLREASSAALLPLLDLARRLAEQNLLSGTDAGAAEAHEMLLDVVLQRSFDVDCEAAPCMLAMHFLANLVARPQLQEALLPVVGQLIRSNRWATLWKMQDSTLARSREVAIAILFNASVALRSACCRVEYSDILKAAVAALRCSPENERINLAVGNLLATGGTSEDAKLALQAQPLPTLRALGAALYRGDLDGPEGCAFPAAWQPRAAAAADGEELAGEAPGQHRRPARAPIPARHRGRRGGG